MTVPAYAASKGGVAQMTKALCNELASKGIQVNAIAPGYMDTDMNVALTDVSNPDTVRSPTGSPPTAGAPRGYEGDSGISGLPGL